MYCVKCGKQAADGTLYCTKCGTKLVTPEDVKATSEERNSTKKSGLKVFIIALVTFLVLSGITAAGLYIFLKADNKSKYEEYDDYDEEDEDDIDDGKSSKSEDEDKKENNIDEEILYQIEPSSVTAEEIILEQMSRIDLISGTVLQKYIETKNYQPYYSFDKVAEGTLGFRVFDFDKDGDNELMQVDALNDDSVVINMYDYNSEKGELEQAIYQAGSYDISDMGQLDVFTFDHNGQQVIGVYLYHAAFLFADGVEIDARFLEYDGTDFVEKDSARYIGSDGEADDGFKRTFNSYGIDIIWEDVFAGRNTVTKYITKDCCIATVFQPCSISYITDENLKKTEFDKTYLGGYNNTEAEEFSYTNSLEGQMAANYIIPDSSTRKLTNEDLMVLSKEELRIARNEILARYGRKFKDKELQEYFNSKSWYEGFIEADDFDENMLNDIESANMYFIKAFENDYDKYH